MKINFFLLVIGSVCSQAYGLSIGNVVSNFSKIESYRISGSLEIETTDETLNYLHGVVNPPIGTNGKSAWANTTKISSYKFTALSKGDRFRINLSKKEGDALVKTVLYRGPNYYVSFDESGSRTASISVKEKWSAVTGISDFCGFLAEYSFLTPEASRQGILPVTPEILQNSNNWKLVDLNTALSKGVETFSVPGGSCVVNFEKSDASGELSLAPRKIDFFNQEGALFRQVEAINFQLFEQKFNIAKDVVITTYQPLQKKQSLKLAHWRFHIEKVEVNPELNNEEFEFDVTLANRIWDADNEITIKVPR